MPIKEGLNDLMQCTHVIEEWMDQATIRSDAHEQAIEDLRNLVRQLVEAQDDLNNRSQCNNIRLRGIPEFIKMDTLASTLREMFCGLLPEGPHAELRLNRANRALWAPSTNITQPQE
ncbi:Hypothetical predicted protein, partial [Pelobates cultripes]